MRPQKQKARRNKTKVRVRGYKLEDISCYECSHYRGKRRGCHLPVCDFERERMPMKHIKAKSERGERLWDM